MSGAKITGVGYVCPNCSKQIKTPHLGFGPDGPCYNFRWPYPEGECCHFNEIIVVSALEMITVSVHTHPAAMTPAGPSGAS